MLETMVEGLESRLFLSAAPVLFNATIKADRLEVKAALLHFQADIFAGEGRLLNDRVALRKALPKGDTSLVAPFAQLQADVKTMHTTLREDRLTESANALVDEAQIKLEIVQILKDKGNSSAEVTDHATLKADRVTLQNALVAGLDARIATRMTDESTISTDAAAIVTAADNDPMTTAALQAAATKFSTDRVALVTTLTADLATIAADRTTLANDLTAAEGT